MTFSPPRETNTQEFSNLLTFRMIMCNVKILRIEELLERDRCLTVAAGVNAQSVTNPHSDCDICNNPHGKSWVHNE